MDNVSFRYTTDQDGWITGVYFGCMSGNCSEFIGDSTDYGYPTWKDWADSVCLNAWRVTVAADVYQLHHDAEREESLLALYEQQKEANSPVTKDLLENGLFNLVAREDSQEGTFSIGNLAIEWGLVEVTSGNEEKEGSYGGSADVVFSRVFAKPPGIVTSFSGSYSNQLSTSCFGVDTSGFKAAVRLTDANSTRKIQWLAVGIINSKAFG